MDPHAVVEALQGALDSALDNLPDAVNDPLFGRAAMVECCKDIAALSHMLAANTDVGQDNWPNVAAYL